MLRAFDKALQPQALCCSRRHNTLMRDVCRPWHPQPAGTHSPGHHGKPSELWGNPVAWKVSCWWHCTEDKQSRQMRQIRKCSRGRGGFLTSWVYQALMAPHAGLPVGGRASEQYSKQKAWQFVKQFAMLCVVFRPDNISDRFSSPMLGMGSF